MKDRKKIPENQVMDYWDRFSIARNVSKMQGSYRGSSKRDRVMEETETIDVVEVEEGSLKIVRAVGVLDDHYASLREMIGIPPEDFDQYYQAACRLLQKKRYEDAADAFFLLTTLEASSFDCWLQLGLAQQKQKHYDEALKSYGIAAIIDVDHPSPHVYAAESYLALDKLNYAVESLRLAKQCLKEGEEHLTIKHQIVQIANLIKKMRQRQQ